MIVFERIAWRNFLSSGNYWTEIALSQNKNTLIMGENGAGKSTLLDALCFVLYNKAFRNINNPQLLNSINGKHLLVEVEFTIGANHFKVVRGLKPAPFEIYKNGKLLAQDGAKKSDQEMLEKHILKMNLKTFRQIIVLGSASFTPFMQLPAAHRREVIEDLLDLQIFTKMNALHKDKCGIAAKELSDVEYEIKVVEEKIKLQQQHIREMMEDTKAMIASKVEEISQNEASIETWTTKIDELMAEIEELEAQIADKGKLEKKRSQLKTLDGQIASRIKGIQKEISFYDTNDNCPTCKQTIDKDFKNVTVAEKEDALDELINGYEKLKEQLTEAEKTLAEYEEVVHKVHAINTKITILNTTVSGCNGTIKRLGREIADLEKKAKVSKADISATLNEEKAAFVKRKEEILFLHETLSHATLILKDSGIKSRIIKQYVPLINKLINKYLAAMEFFCQFELDETFNETIKARYRDEFSYASFSEGEKMRINLAILFTWRAIAKLRNSAATNLLIMDEVFDSSLDTSGTEEFMKILNSLTPDTNTFIISHKGDGLADKFENIIRFQKVNQFSRIAA